LHRDPSRHTIVTVEKVVAESPTVRTLVFSDGVMPGAEPGQFAMVWVPGIGELPMSVMISEEPGRAAFTVRRHGTTSSGLYDTGAGQKIGIRGPYGNSFDVRPGKILLVGGGTGLVPLMRLLTVIRPDHDVTVLVGARTKDEVFFEDLAGRLLAGASGRILVTTEDGTRGTRGLVTDLVDRLTAETVFDGVYTCGPELMMYKTVQLARSRGMFVQASLERVMKCGVGICGSCCAGPDLVCRDGTVFDGEHLASNREFGRAYRNKAGMLENY